MIVHFVRATIILLVVIEIGWFIAPHSGSLMGNSYRNHERIKALTKYANEHTTTTRTTVDKELDLLSEHESNRDIVIFAILIGVDVAIVFMFWNFHKPASNRRRGSL
jgi:hypothetical protein